ncbi:MAG: trypsin-like peptidase domain-containing protein [Bacilli bacterium]|nr:trypsin-like peptidase domain-containing protein [Bacilli bacterium]
MKKQRVLISIILVLFMCLFLFACGGGDINSFYIKRIKEISVNVGETYTFDDNYESSNSEIFKMDESTGTALKLGDVYISLSGEETPIYLVHITNDPKYIDVEVERIIKVGESADLVTIVSPLTASQTVKYEISDESIIKIENNQIIGLTEGYCDLTVTSLSNPSVKTEVAIIVENEDEANYEDKIEYEIVNETSHSIDSSNIGSEINALVKNVEKAFIGIMKYTKNEVSDFGGGVLYKRGAILNDGTTIDDVNVGSDFANIKSFEYYVITTRNFASSADKLEIYLGSEYDTYEATLVSFDPKVDLALLKFNCPYYLPLIKLGDSDDIKQGEFVISINNSNGQDYFRTVTYGIISSTKRYIATDTDDDQTSDWDSEFIQHDASINSEAAKKVVYTSGDIYNYINGGALINLKGELIGLDSMKISAIDSSVNNMSLSIPTNLIIDITKILITGKQPQRPLLGVTILDITAYYKNKDYYDELYGNMNIPDGLEYGFYINEIVEGGVAYQANAQIGDILIKFNGVETKYSYMLRAELGKFIIGSGDTASLVVLRNGEEVTLTVAF